MKEVSVLGVFGKERATRREHERVLRRAICPFSFSNLGDIYKTVLLCENSLNCTLCTFLCVLYLNVKFYLKLE